MTREQQKRIDFIYATGAVASKNSPVLSFTGSAAFRHVMSRLVVKLKPGDGLTTPDIAIGGHYIDGLIQRTAPIRLRGRQHNPRGLHRDPVERQTGVKDDRKR